MDPVEASAKFAAYVWFMGRNTGGISQEAQAISFAQDNWRVFLPNAHKGLGRLLIRLAIVRSRCGRMGRPAA